MPATLKHAISYPAGTVAPNVPVSMQSQAESVDVALVKVAGLKHAEFTGPVVTQTAGTGTNFGTLGADATKTFNNAFCTGGTGGAVTITQTGVYTFTSLALPAGPLGTTHLWATSAGDTLLSANGSSYGNNTQTATFTAYLAAGAVVTFGVTGSNTQNLGSRVKVTKIQDL